MNIKEESNLIFDDDFQNSSENDEENFSRENKSLISISSGQIIKGLADNYINDLFNNKI
jgi:hypothetical protein